LLLNSIKLVEGTKTTTNELLGFVIQEALLLAESKDFGHRFFLLLLQLAALAVDGCPVT
jgi:hypothetical protein